jgi:hypothetical protein
MPLFPSTPRRVLKQTRLIQIEAFAREDGLWDIDACITDKNQRNVRHSSGSRLATGAASDVHSHLLIDPAFRAFFSSGLSTVPAGAFSAELLRFPSISVIQSYVGKAIVAPSGENPETIGSQCQTRYRLDRCHALRSDGAAAVKYYPPRSIPPSTVSSFN